MKINSILGALIIFILFAPLAIHAQQLTTLGKPAELILQEVSNGCIRITLKPLSHKGALPANPALVEMAYPKSAIHVLSINKKRVIKMSNLTVSITPNPLNIHITNQQNQLVQELVFQNNNSLSFALNGNEKVLGMGEGGPKPERGTNWRLQKVQFNRRGRLDSMQPRWQGDAYGSRNPAAVLIGTSGWGLFVATPWVLVDLRPKNNGFFIPWQSPANVSQPQNQRNQGMNMGKGLPPVNQIIEGLFDLFVFDAHEPDLMMKNFSKITGPAVLPPKWALGYMQSHRTLQDDAQLTGIVDTFRTKKIPIDAVIYLGTGFTPSGWNTTQPSFQFNPEVFKKDPKIVLSALHKNNVKIVLHMVPWDRDKLPTLHGNIPAMKGEELNASHIANYWKQHESLVTAGVDAFWPDEGDWFNLSERIKRHQLYYQGHLSTSPKKRPWSLHRNGYPGIAKWGGWVWSGDTESSWKTLEAQIAVGLNYSLSIAPFWGSDIGGFYPTEEYSGEMYARWHQFATFNASFRSHGRTWWLHLPWGWGRNDMGPKENRVNAPETELNNPAIEPVIKQYNELRYQLMPYSYTLAWQARLTGLPMMRALWLHYPHDTIAAEIGDQFLWGKDMLVAPVYEKNATSKKIYLPAGGWYDWWTNEFMLGAKIINRAVNLSILPLYIKAGAIIPFDTIRQSTADTMQVPLTIKIYTGASGNFVLYEDDGESQEYLEGISQQTKFIWDDKLRHLTIEPVFNKASQPKQRIFKIEWVAQKHTQLLRYTSKKMIIKLP